MKSTWELAPGKCTALEIYIDLVEPEIEDILSKPIRTLDNPNKRKESPSTR